MWYNLCGAHGGGKRCGVEGCEKKEVGGYNFCSAHGGRSADSRVHRFARECGFLMQEEEEGDDLISSALQSQREEGVGQNKSHDQARLSRRGDAHEIFQAGRGAEEGRRGGRRQGPHLDDLGLAASHCRGGGRA